MSDERWDVPSATLKRIASAEPAPQFRECGRCPHRHARGERCGYPIHYESGVCECTS